MSTDYSGNSANNPTAIQLPSDGDNKPVSSVNPALQGIMDLLRRMLDRISGGNIQGEVFVLDSALLEFEAGSILRVFSDLLLEGEGTIRLKDLASLVADSDTSIDVHGALIVSETGQIVAGEETGVQLLGEVTIGSETNATRPVFPIGLQTEPGSTSALSGELDVLDGPIKYSNTGRPTMRRVNGANAATTYGSASTTPGHINADVVHTKTLTSSRIYTITSNGCIGGEFMFLRNSSGGAFQMLLQQDDTTPIGNVGDGQTFLLVNNGSANGWERIL